MAKVTMTRVKAGRDAIVKTNLDATVLMDRINAARDVLALIEVATDHCAAVSSDIKTLIPELKTYDPNAIAEVERLKTAEIAAQAGDGNGIMTALKGTPRWIGDLALKVGASVLGKIIEKQMGL